MAKQAWEKFRKKKPTHTAEVVISCHADDRLFLPNFADMPKPMQKIFQGEKRIALPCSGSGQIGVWCNECVFGEVADDY